MDELKRNKNFQGTLKLDEVIEILMTSDYSNASSSSDSNSDLDSYSTNTFDSPGFQQTLTRAMT